MNEEERKKLIKKLHTLQDFYIEDGYQGFAGVIHKTINLIEKQEEIIQAIAEKIAEYKDYLEGIPEDDMWHEECFLYNKISDCYAYNDCQECIIEYFTKKLGE